ncbi:hypothetical protein N7468_002467 [Penicillium chermesinum]|uniref:Uncharacterized protein n=1 Tax=Penicillium chermesinum TaxID=63820 RepID=A0A9W9PIT3_9EURO|nr:uncharacterized protein N7468_002467 [Penicillium chermesinum]KAJ5247484.1 hypothetical protein N7468_002467 [Penicillium chermesinum]
MIGGFREVIFNADPCRRTLDPIVVVGVGRDSFLMTLDCQGLFDRFINRTVLTFGGSGNENIYQKQVVELAFQRPFLMHIILTITATHDRFIQDGPGSHKQSLAESYHGAKGAQLLSRKLSSQIHPDDRDPIWASAAMLGISSMTTLEAAAPREAWPFKPSESADLNWMDMSARKEAILNLTDPFRGDSIFRSMKDTFFTIMERPASRPIDELPKDFVELCSINNTPDPEENPYYYAISMLAGLRYLKCNRDSIPFWLKFIGFMTPEFRRLLELKDPRALLLTAYWYAPLCGSVWWIARRARLECQSICLYLETYYSQEVDIQKLLELPRQASGLSN